MPSTGSANGDHSYSNEVAWIRQIVEDAFPNFFDETWWNQEAFINVENFLQNGTTAKVFVFTENGGEKNIVDKRNRQKLSVKAEFPKHVSGDLLYFIKLEPLQQSPAQEGNIRDRITYGKLQVNTCVDSLSQVFRNDYLDKVIKSTSWPPRMCFDVPHHAR
jgi:hypothetical protein